MDTKRSVHISNIPYSLTENGMDKMITDILGKTEYNLNMPLHRDSKNNRGFCNIEFETKELADKFIESANQSEVEGREIHVDHLKERTNTRENRSYLVKISNLNFSVTMEDIQEFLKGGEEVILGIDKLGQQKHQVVSYKD